MSAADILLKRKSAGAKPAVTVLPDATELRLPLARVHEVCGPARHRMAMWIAGQTRGPVLWVAPRWAQDSLSPCSFAALVDPARLVFVQPDRREDILWTMEEILRSGAAALAVADLPGLPGLTQVRRMHLAAETGGREGAGSAPLGLLLTPGDGGAPGVETRWHLSAQHATLPGRWRLARRRARTAPEAAWTLDQTARSPWPVLSPSDAAPAQTDKNDA